MAAYTTDAKLLRLLPPSASLPATVDTEAERLVYIQEASLLVQDMVGPRFGFGSYGSATQKFPDASSSPATPMTIQTLTAYVAAALILDHMQMTGTEYGAFQSEELRKVAQAMASDIREGVISVTDSAGTDYAVSDLASTTQGAAPVFRRNMFDRNGDEVGDENGSLDGLTT